METIELVCEGAPENRIEYKAGITPRQINAYLKAISENDEAALEAVYRETIVDCCFVIEGEAVHGLTDVLALDTEDMPVMVSAFWGRSFTAAVKQARELGKPQRRS